MDSINISGRTYDGRVHTLRLVIGHSSVEEPCKICSLLKGIRKGSKYGPAIVDYLGCVSGMLVLSTITASSEWHQDKQMGRGVGGCGIIETCCNGWEPTAFLSLNGLNDLGF